MFFNRCGTQVSKQIIESPDLYIFYSPFFLLNRLQEEI